jgi:endonuclease IV
VINDYAPRADRRCGNEVDETHGGRFINPNGSNKEKLDKSVKYILASWNRVINRMERRRWKEKKR